MLKFSALTHEVSQALTALIEVIEKRNTIPILGCVVIEACPPEHGHVLITGTDLDMGLTMMVDATVHQAGKVAVPARSLQRFVAAMGVVTLDFEQLLKPEGTILSVSQGETELELPTMAPEDFPLMRVGGDFIGFGLEADALSDLFRTVQYACYTEETRFYLNGICFETPAPNVLRGVATDGHRLGLRDLALPPVYDTLDRRIVPRKTCKVLGLLCPAVQGQVQFDFYSDRLFVKTDGWRMISRLVDGQYPDYPRVFPKNNDNIAIVEKAALLAGVQRVTSIMRDSSPAITIELGNKKSIGLAAASIEREIVCDDVAADYSGVAQFVGVNGFFLRQVLERCPDGPIRFAFGDPATPIVISIDGDAVSQHLLMPMRVTGGGMSRVVSEPKARERDWWPAGYVDESMPAGRPSPSDWIADKDPDTGLWQIDFEEGQTTTFAIAEVGTLAFVHTDIYPDVTIEIAADKSYEIIRGSVPAEANHFVNSEDDEDSMDSIGEWVANHLEHNEPEEYPERVTLAVVHHGAEILFRLVVTGDKASFVKIEPVTEATP